jgi:hypothetical protein
MDKRWQILEAKALQRSAKKASRREQKVFPQVVQMRTGRRALSFDKRWGTKESEVSQLGSCKERADVKSVGRLCGCTCRDVGIQLAMTPYISIHVCW